MAYNMKNSALKMSAKTGSPMQGNYASPMKQWWNPFNKEVKSERVDEKSYGGFSENDNKGDPYSTEKKSRTYQNKITGNRKVKTKETKKSGGPGYFMGSRTDTKKTTTKQDAQNGEFKNTKQTVKKKTKVKGGATGNYKWGSKTSTNEQDKMNKSK